MSVNPIDSSYQNPAKMPTEAVGAEQEQAEGGSEINKLNDEIKQVESEIKETAKELQKALSESIGGSSEKVQMLQNKMQMQQQEVLMKQMKIKEIKSPEKAMTDKVTKPKLDKYVAGDDAANKPDNVYRVEEKDGIPTIIFNRPEN